uniref:Uncharacterized protein n=1 Tax=Strigamia maritima TaxID=126957 RepID=T1IKZ8_STRMM
MDVLKQAHQNMYRMIQRNYERHLAQHKGLTSGMSAKRDGPWEVTKILGGGAYALGKLENGAVEKSVNIKDLVPYIPSFPIEVLSEDQTKATNDNPPNPKWMNEDSLELKTPSFKNYKQISRGLTLPLKYLVPLKFWVSTRNMPWHTNHQHN